MTLLLALVFWLCVLALVYTFGGYAVVMTILARVIHRPVRAAPITSSVSLIIPAYNEQAVIAEKKHFDVGLQLQVLATYFEVHVLSPMLNIYGHDQRTSVIMSPDVKDWEKSVRVSVIVPAFNAADTLANCLNALQGQTRCPDEIIVVDDGSTDDTAIIAQAFGVLVLQQSHTGPAAARNLGVRHASGDIIMFTDADCEPQFDWVEQMLKPFADPRVVGAKGRYCSQQSELLARLVQLEFEDKYRRMSQFETIDFIDTYSAAYRRVSFLQLGGFNETFPTASVEDIEFSFRLSERNMRLVFVPQAQVWHVHPISLIHYLKRKARYGYWRALVYLWHPKKIIGDSHTDPMLKIQFGLVALGGLSAVITLMNIYWLGISLLVTLLLIATTIPFAIRAGQRDWLVALIAPPVHLIRAVVQAFALIVGLVVHGVLHRNRTISQSGRTVL